MEHPIDALPRTPFPASRDFAPVGSMSLDSRVAGLPYESSSFATSRRNESVTGLAFCITWHDKHSVIGSLRSPPPFPLRGTSPYAGGRIKHRETIFS